MTRRKRGSMFCLPDMDPRFRGDDARRFRGDDGLCTRPNLTPPLSRSVFYFFSPFVFPFVLASATALAGVATSAGTAAFGAASSGVISPR